MPSSAADFQEQIISQIKTLLPDLSLDPLTPERKIVDTIANVLATGSIDPYVLSYMFDIDTKVGADLDAFVALFGFARKSGSQATGIVTFSRQSPATADIIIDAGTNVLVPTSAANPQVTFITTAATILPTGSTSVDVPVQCTDVGQQGNVPANAINILSQNSDISAVNNATATTGGSPPEVDADLRLRFKNTIFRNVSGTKDQFLALALATVFANKANVLGPQDRYVEYLQIPDTLSTASIISYSKYTYPFSYYLTNGAIGSEVFYNKGGVDYTLTTSVPPVITVNNVTNIPVGSIVLLEHTYTSANSRNDPSNNILNYVDVYVNGDDAQPATDVLQFGSTTFSASSVNVNYNEKWIRTADDTYPVVGNYFTQMLWQPVDTIPSVITINNQDYLKGIHYWQVRDTTVNKGSKNARDGIEWDSTVANSVTSTMQFTFTYEFNELPSVLNELMEEYKQTTSDILVHAATERYFIVNLVTMYSPGFTQDAVDTDIITALTAYFQNLNFGDIVQISDILELVHQVSGVDNVRLAQPGDGVAYGIQEVSSTGVLVGLPLTADFELTDCELGILDGMVSTRKAQNTF
jgi:uncharacterized phage protein gp47/JayE